MLDRVSPRLRLCSDFSREAGPVRAGRSLGCASAALIESVGGAIHSNRAPGAGHGALPNLPHLIGTCVEGSAAWIRPRANVVPVFVVPAFLGFRALCVVPRCRCFQQGHPTVRGFRPRCIRLPWNVFPDHQPNWRRRGENVAYKRVEFDATGSGTISAQPGMLTGPLLASAE